MTEGAVLQNRCRIVIDAGHGGVDGGATSCTGVLESNINLDIALRLNDLLRLLGYRTEMIRTEDISVYTEGETIGAKKISDLKERVRIINDTENALLVSIHQNYFAEEKYSGSQVFYAATDGSKELAQAMQASFHEYLAPGNTRKVKPCKGIFLMEKISTTGILIECGFLSNRTEEALLRDATYQKKLCCVIASVLSNHLDR